VGIDECYSISLLRSFPVRPDTWSAAQKHYSSLPRPFVATT
jgi:hypothetical protein